MRKIKNEFDHLVNPNFDLEEVTKNAKPEIDAKYKMNPDTGYLQMN